jgi:hypothetical protein
MAEKLLSHVPLDADADDVAPVLDDKDQAGLQDINQQKYDGPNNEQSQILIGNVIVNDIFCNHRIEQVAAGYDERTCHVQRKKLPVGFIIFCKFF